MTFRVRYVGARLENFQPLFSVSKQRAFSVQSPLRGSNFISKVILNSVKSISPELDSHDIGFQITQSKHEFGDYQSNVALLLSKRLRLKPQDLAEKLRKTIELSLPKMIDKVDVSGPGFLNFRFSEKYLQSRLFDMLHDSARLGIPPVEQTQKIIVDFSSPNIAKEMHVGHLRSTIIGDSISRVFEFLGHDVLRLNHIGDWGTQFGMLIHFMKQNAHHERDSSSPSPSDPSTPTIKDLVEFYKSAKKLFDSDTSFQEASREEVVRLQRGEEASLRAWREICDLSRAQYAQIYELLGVEILERGESFYNPYLAEIVGRLLELGVAQEQQGTVLIFPEGYQPDEDSSHDNPITETGTSPITNISNPSVNLQSITENPNKKKSNKSTPTRPSPPTPLIIRKSDGGYLYGTTDLAAVRHRVQVERANKVIYVTDSGQEGHFRLVFEAARRAGFTKGNPTSNSHDSEEAQLIHVPFGLVLGEDGKKFRSRSGDSVKLRDLLDEAVRLAEENMIAKERERHQIQSTVHSSLSMDQSNQKEIARVIGLSAVKYADLSMNRTGDYRFSFSKMLSLSGNTAPYMLYAFARIQGIKRRVLQEQPSSEEEEFRVDAESFEMVSPEERALLFHLTRMEEVIFDVSKNLLPNQICDYLFELSLKFNAFYENCPVLKAPSTASRKTRIALCSLTAGMNTIINSLSPSFSLSPPPPSYFFGRFSQAWAGSPRYQDLGQNVIHPGPQGVEKDENREGGRTCRRLTT